LTNPRFGCEHEPNLRYLWKIGMWNKEHAESGTMPLVFVETDNATGGSLWLDFELLFVLNTINLDVQFIS
jgi:hypothetical protein